MMDEQERILIDTFPWKSARKIAFFKSKRKMIFEFDNGYVGELISPSEEKWDDMIRKAALYLDNDQQKYME